MAFSDLLKNDAQNGFIGSDNEFTETITYKPASGLNKGISAIVEREQLEPNPQGGNRTLSHEIEISILNDADLGVTSVAERADKVSLPILPGGTAVDWLVQRVIAMDDGVFRLSIRR